MELQNMALLSTNNREQLADEILTYIWKNKEGKKIPTIPQKLNWKRNSSYDTFDEADKVRTELKKDNEHVKVRRCGLKGLKFKVVIGTAVKVKKNKKEESKDATE